MKIELFQVPGCPRCDTQTSELRVIAETAGTQWFEVNALDALDRAVDLGVLTLPALVIDGELAFSALPTQEALRRELTRRAQHG